MESTSGSVKIKCREATRAHSYFKQQHRELMVFRDLYQPHEKIPFEKDTTVSHTVLLITPSPGRNQ
jgi:hypothetical protein